MVTLSRSNTQLHDSQNMLDLDAREPTLLDEVRARLEVAASYMKLSSFELEILQNPRKQLSFQIPVELDSGERVLFKGHRVQWNDARGPYKGGVRFHPAEDEETIQGLAALMMLKTAVMDLPLGGAKGGVNCQPAQLSDRELERISRGFARAIVHDLGPEIDVPAPDMYTNDRVMGWMSDELQQISHRFRPGAITGKPLCLGGSLGRVEATARGALVALRELAGITGANIQGPALAVHGFGNIGSNVLRLADKLLGCHVVAVCDSKSGIYDPEGLPVQETLDHHESQGSFLHCSIGEQISPVELLQLHVPVLVLASKEGVIDEHNASEISAKFILEVANGPTTKSGEQALMSNEILLIPDLLCNAGGVTVSYFEQVQNASNYYWPADKVSRRLDMAMAKAVQSIWSKSEMLGTDLRTAAYVTGAERVAEAMRARGWC